MLAVPHFMSSLRAHRETLVSLRAHGTLLYIGRLVTCYEVPAPPG